MPLSLSMALDRKRINNLEYLTINRNGIIKNKLAKNNLTPGE